MWGWKWGWAWRRKDTEGNKKRKGYRVLGSSSWCSRDPRGVLVSQVSSHISARSNYSEEQNTPGKYNESSEKLEWEKEGDGETERVNFTCGVLRWPPSKVNQKRKKNKEEGERATKGQGRRSEMSCCSPGCGRESEDEGRTEDSYDDAPVVVLVLVVLMVVVVVVVEFERSENVKWKKTYKIKMPELMAKERRSWNGPRQLLLAISLKS